MLFRSTIVVKRFDDTELERRRQRAEADSTVSRASRRRRVAGSQRRADREAAREHDHDHDEHDHDHDEHDHDHAEDDEPEVAEVVEAEDEVSK